MRRLVGVAALVVMLAACEARLEMSVRNDGSGTMGFTFLAPKEALEAMRSFGGDPFEEMRQDLANDPVGWKVTNVTEPAGSGIQGTFEFTDVTDLKAKLDALNEEDGDDPFVDGQLVLERSGSGWRFEAKANAPTSSDFAPQPPGGSPPGFEQANPLSGLDSMLGGLRFVFRITLPGKAANTNAARVTATKDGTRFEWTFTTKDGQPDGAQQLVASTAGAAASGSGTGSFPAVPVGVATVLVGGVAALLIRRRPQAPPAPVLEGFPTPAPPALGADVATNGAETAPNVASH